ncbi:IS3 family transposase [Brevibacillus laterosporus]|nr:IS3 family transposase [Brevibacillus laterosporus]
MSISEDLCQEHRFRYGYRKITALLRRVMQINHKRVQRIMREEGLQCRVKVKKAKENRTTDTGCGSSFETGFSGESSATEAGHRHYLPALRRKNVVLIHTMARSSPTILETSKILPSLRYFK